ncbi:hypothetical protein CA54_38820 [Symmachiella macrocystis]|uniref:Uncharacterized protein n=1 Tax=Symmachiella macrocystis TaxID=2527985 RepID=A0A5C6BBL4_9PLAN|nr:hypothetical protein [Symmachiella macrocystis]TWU08646.1 hypothetical protein CA54_38820 [Symmachiella macrocystis]
MPHFYFSLFFFLFVAITAIGGILEISEGREDGRSLLEVISLSGFALCMGLFVWMNSPIWFVPGFLFWNIGYVCQEKRTKRRRRQLAELRAVNGADYPELLREPPLSCPAEQLPYRPGFRVFNNETGELLGTLTRPQLQTLIRDFLDLIDSSNDFYLHKFMLELGPYPDQPELTALLLEFMGDEEDLELRWTL